VVITPDNKLYCVSTRFCFWVIFLSLLLKLEKDGNYKSGLGVYEEIDKANKSLKGEI
jgi:hypothetical protein